MKLAKVTSKGQTTIPKAIREAARLKEGDVLSLEVKGDYLLVRKVAGRGDDYLRAVEGTLDEWASPEDDEAWRDLWDVRGGRALPRPPQAHHTRQGIAPQARGRIVGT